ncbi:hypothetical protein [Moraxella sp. ZY200743]|uniref:hypothetical protein n=1 Tax=Moraxella sp. ZY200743 TaxID=2911970 RepID=UPI003D7D3182
MSDSLSHTGTAGAIVLLANKFKEFKDDILKKNTQNSGEIAKLKAFTGYQDDLDLLNKVTEILGE